MADTLLNKQDNWIIVDISPSGKILHCNSSQYFSKLEIEKFSKVNYEVFIDEIVNIAYSKEVKRLINQILSNKLQSIEFFSELKNEKNSLVLFQIKASALPEIALTILITRDKNKKIYKNKINEARLRSMRVIDYANLVIVRISPDFRITDTLGNSEKILGLKKREVQNDKNIWQKLFGTKQARELLLKLKNSSNIYREISSEVLLKTKFDKRQNWIMLRATPLYSRYGEFLGWEGFGIDISDKKYAEKSLLSQNLRIKALYDVSKVLHESNDPAFLALKGMERLIEATDATSGFIAFFNRSNKTIEVVAARGLSLRYLRKIQNVFKQDKLILKVIRKNKQIVFNKYNNFASNLKEIYIEEKINSGIITPLVKGSNSSSLSNFGVIAIFKKDFSEFTQIDYDVIKIASKQISLVFNQAEFVRMEKEQLDSQAKLYDLSRELSLPANINEILLKSYPVIDSKFKLKSLWFGKVEKETNEITDISFIRGMEEVNYSYQKIALDSSLQSILDSFNKKSLQVIESDDINSIGVLGKFYKNRVIKNLILLPLISLGKVIGLIIIEPRSEETLSYKSKLPFLRGVANEIATVLLSKHFEAKLAESEKMKLAGLLSSGVAHNFNNILQAILGQATLIEIQAKDNKLLKNASKEIASSVNKGALIIKQMLSFSDSSIVRRKNVSLNDFLKKTYISLKNSIDKINFELIDSKDEILVKIDTFQFKQLINNLVINSKESLVDTKEPYIKINLSLVTIEDRYLNQELKSGVYALIKVSDNGKGMDAEQVKHCFEPFYTSKKHSKAEVGFDGSGLGLAFSLAIARQHNGSISVKSRVGKGSTFYLYLPILEQDKPSRLDHNPKNTDNQLPLNKEEVLK